MTITNIIIPKNDFSQSKPGRINVVIFHDIATGSLFQTNGRFGFSLESHFHQRGIIVLLQRKQYGEKTKRQTHSLQNSHQNV